MNRISENNNVVIRGQIISEFEFSHQVFGERFYTAEMAVERLSGVLDIIPIMVSERLVDVDEECGWQYVEVTGDFRSYNKNEGNRTRVLLFVFATGFDVLNELQPSDFENKVVLDGYICKRTSYRKTPLGRDISDIILAVNRPYGKSDYIPCICWGRNAVFASGLDVGMHIKVEGRLQSREYVKKFDDGTQEIRTAYEASISKIEVVEETED